MYAIRSYYGQDFALTQAQFGSAQQAGAHAGQSQHVLVQFV